tara:strand:- start:1498 stop:2274 length:777 start_codon:yes stop_codon:yes gene_type:complete
MSSDIYKKQIELNKKKFAREQLAEVEIGFRNRKTGESRVEILSEEVIRNAMKGDDDSIVEVSLFLIKKIEQDKRLYFKDARDGAGKLKEGKEAPVNNGAISWPLAKFVTAKIISVCHKKKKLLPRSLHKLMLLVLGDETFYSKNVESYLKKRRARDFAVAFPSASLRQIADYAGEKTSPNSAKKWCVRKAENLLGRIADDTDRASTRKSIEAECKALGLQIPKDDPTKKKGIYELLKKEMSRRGEKKSKKGLLCRCSI